MTSRHPFGGSAKAFRRSVLRGNFVSVKPISRAILAVGTDVEGLESRNALEDGQPVVRDFRAADVEHLKFGQPAQYCNSLIVDGGIIDVKGFEI